MPQKGSPPPPRPQGTGRGSYQQPAGTKFLAGMPYQSDTTHETKYLEGKLNQNDTHETKYLQAMDDKPAQSASGAPPNEDGYKHVHVYGTDSLPQQIEPGTVYHVHPAPPTQPSSESLEGQQ